MRGSIGITFADRSGEIHVREDVALDVDAGRDLDQFEPLRRELEDAALGDVEHRLPALAPRSGPLKVICSTASTNLRVLPFGHDPDLTVVDRDLQAARREGSGEHHGAGVLADVDEAARSRRAARRTG